MSSGKITPWFEYPEGEKQEGKGRRKREGRKETNAQATEKHDAYDGHLPPLVELQGDDARYGGEEYDDVDDHVDDAEDEVEERDVDAGAVRLAQVLAPVEADGAAGGGHDDEHDDGVAQGEGDAGPLRIIDES